MSTWRRASAVAVVSTAVVAFLALVLRPAADRSPQAVPRCRWLAGDVDVHTAHTFVSARNRSLEEALAYSLSVEEQAGLAAERGLDFIAITDYSDVSAQLDPAYGDYGLVWIPAYEHPFAGVAQLLGVTETIPVGAVSTAEVRRVVQQVQDNGGVFQIGNPGDHRWSDAYWTKVVPNALEVWFAGPWSYDPGKVGKDQTFSIGYYDDLLDAGHKVAATGGGNSLFRGITKLAGVGQPTTWVCARERTAASLLEAIAAGRTTISHEFPTQASLTEGDSRSASGPVVRTRLDAKEDFGTVPPDTDIPFMMMEGDSDDDGDFESLLGDAVSPGSKIRVGVFGGPFSVLRLVADGSEVIGQVDVFTPAFVHRLRVPQGVTWIRAELFARPEDTVGGLCDVSSGTASYCHDRIGMLALTSPLYVGSE